ncbi:hypothetical protein JAAARDRAFT_192425 [Jaapia argillacea MUCL 33604]|uniref:Uncharacterized protein n=1 Tax=Jaapia argillacea MUCL 33604 TaxID=933084 RepID=A0A067Q5R4_9AGAM|nr:hypothetical protein JAAARDRAFT_192425 [Jaapia argillacea MUCL 33604]
MSDDYASTGFKGSLVNNSADTKANAPGSEEYRTGNYPPANDSTSSGGYGSTRDAFSKPSQRGQSEKASQAGPNLVDQSVMSGPEDQTQDAMQGQDLGSRRQFEREQGKEQSSGLNPYGTTTLEGRGQAEEALGSRYRDARDRGYEGGGAPGNDEDIGA